MIGGLHIKVQNETNKLLEQFEDLRGELNEEIKRRKREKSEFLNEITTIQKKFDKGRDQVDKSLK